MRIAKAAVAGLIVIALMGTGACSSSKKQEDAAEQTEAAQTTETSDAGSSADEKTETQEKAGDAQAETKAEETSAAAETETKTEDQAAETKTEAAPTTTAPQEEEEKLYEIGTWEKNGETKALKWRAINVSLDGETTMLCCTESVARMPYKESTVVKTSNWERSDVRAWLNDEFYYQAFSEEERGQIVTTTVMDYGKDNKAAGTTEDNVFILSLNQAKSFLKSSQRPSNSW